MSLMLIAHQKYLLPVSRHVALIVWPCSTKCHLKSTVSGILYFLFSTFLMSLTLGGFLFVSVRGFKIHLYDIDKKESTTGQIPSLLSFGNIFLDIWHHKCLWKLSRAHSFLNLRIHNDSNEINFVIEIHFIVSWNIWHYFLSLATRCHEHYLYEACLSYSSHSEIVGNYVRLVTCRMLHSWGEMNTIIVHLLKKYTFFQYSLNRLSVLNECSLSSFVEWI